MILCEIHVEFSGNLGEILVKIHILYSEANMATYNTTKGMKANNGKHLTMITMFNTVKICQQRSRLFMLFIDI